MDSYTGHIQGGKQLGFAIIYYILARSEVSKKTAFWVPFWEHVGDKIVEIGVQMSSKKVVKIGTQIQ